MTLSLVITDLHLGSAAPEAAAAEAFPPLPALGRLLDWAVARRVDSGWRAGLLLDAGLAEAARIPPAAIAAQALPASVAGPDVCFAQPVHRVAGISRVHLHPAGLLRLEDRGAQQLCASFNRELGQHDLQLHRVGEGLLLTGVLGPGGASELQDPGRFLGQELGPAHAQPSAPLRRLGAETEMWLYEHPLNEARAGRGELPVNALWFWGAGARLAAGALSGGAHAAPLCVFGEDPFLVGLWSVLGGEVRSGIARFDQWVPQPSCIVISAAPQLQEAPKLAQLETDWFAPVLEALDSRALDSVRLRIGGMRWDIRRRGLSRWWRRPVPWWRRVAA